MPACEPVQLLAGRLNQIARRKNAATADQPVNLGPKRNKRAEIDQSQQTQKQLDRSDIAAWRERRSRTNHFLQARECGAIRRDPPIDPLRQRRESGDMLMSPKPMAAPRRVGEHSE